MCLATELRAQLPPVPAAVTILPWNCFDIAARHVTSYCISKAICVYTKRCGRVYSHVNVQSPILLHDFSGRHNSSSDCASIIRSVA